MKHLIIIFFLLFSVLSHLVNGQEPDYIFQSISPPEGFTYGSIANIAEDAHGFIWFGTEHGLYRYNTRKVELFIFQQDDPNSIPSDNIQEILKDSRGILWIGTNGGLCYFDETKQHFVRLNYKDIEKKGLSEEILQLLENSAGELFSLHESHICRVSHNDSTFRALPLELPVKGDYPTFAVFDDTDQMWVGTQRGYVFKSEPPYQDFQLFGHHRPDRVQYICMDNNTFWIGYELKGVDHVNENGLVIHHYDQMNENDTKLPHNRIRKIIKDNENRIWIGTIDGLAVVVKNKVQRINKDYYNNLPHNSIHSIFIDSRNGMWLGTWSGGLAYKNNYDNRFLHFNRNPDHNSLSSNVVSSFAEEKDGTIWVSTEEGGINHFDRKNKTFTAYNLKGTVSGTANIKCLSIDYKERLWIGTYSGGLWNFDRKSKTFKNYAIFKNEVISVYDIAPEGNGLWLGTYGTGLFFYDPETNKLEDYLSVETDPYSLSSNQIRSLLVDSYGGLWVGTQHGLNYKTKGNNQFARYFYNSREGKRISNNQVFELFEDSSGKIWIGTGGGGVDIYDPKTSTFSNMSPKNGLAGYNVYGILEDHSGNIWLSTEKGLSCYAPKAGTFRNYFKEDGLQGNQFSPGAAYWCSNGDFLFGGPNGFNLFNPENITKNPLSPKVLITELEINNVRINPDDPQSPVKNCVSTLSEIKLPHGQNSLTFGFVANNFIQPTKNQFKYRLVNYQNDWIDNGNEGKATFTKIPSGKYILEILGSNNDGVWNDTPTQLKIYIRYPFWRSTFAYVFYFAILLTGLWLLRREFLIRQRLRNEVLLERVQRENEENLHQMKLQIFTNISHEFRTPLALILSPLEHVLAKKDYDEDTSDHLTMIQRNAHRLMRLINQIIDFRKFELNKVEYYPVRTDLVKLCFNICNYFEVHARDKSISFQIESAFKKYELEIDQDKLDKVIFNLLSNAFKYTPDSGTIKVVIEETELPPSGLTAFSTNPNLTGQAIAIRISDNGPGISTEEVPQIFERFYRGTLGKNQGTGIGLHLCREYTRLHEGAITVNSALGEGSVFSVVLPCKKGCDATVAKEKLLKSWENSHKPLPESQPTEPVEKQNNAILIVEDNTDMQKQIRNLLADEYKVLLASNGVQGLEMARDLYPDLVISDVMMPEMDGFELCKHLKDDLQTSHIPVILLTALSETDKRIDGLETGADAYLVKPFENKLLRAQISNLLTSRKRLQQSFKESEEKWADDSNLMHQDKKLVERAIHVVEKHLLNPNFSVEQLADELGVSRSTLHRKMRVLTNQSATEFVRYVRMKKAIKLMKEGNFNIDEIGYAVGFNSHSYFTQCFKKQFGMTPSEYIQEQKAK